MLNMKNNWQEVEGRLKIELELEDFMSCVDLINKIAETAERMDHHPNITI
jgi:pterin-4a-carbinolamine dehydratase